MAYTALNTTGINQEKGITYSGTTATSADWGSVPADSYFYDFQTGLPYYKNASDVVISVFEEGGGTPALNNGQVFVGNASNEANSVPMSGDVAITTSGVTTIQSDAVTYDKIQDTTQAALLGNQSGAGTVAEIPIVEQYISSSGTIAGYLNATANWDVNGNYLGTAPTITGTFQGQSHYNGNYWFTAVDDNVWIRLIRG